MKTKDIATLALVVAVIAGGAYAFGLTQRVTDARKLIVLAGQSNASGGASDAALLPADRPTVPFWWDEPGFSNSAMKWVHLSPQPLLAFPKGHFGPEYGIAAAMPDAAIFKFTSGASSLAKDWKPGSVTGLAQRFEDELEVAMKGTNATPYCFVLVQGESDAETKEMATTYADRLKALIGAIRSKMGSDVRIVLSVDELHPWVVANHEVVAAQKALADADLKISFSSFSDLPKADSTHLVAAGTLEQGKRLAEACRAIP